MQKLHLIKVNQVEQSLMLLKQYKTVCEFSKLIRMICVSLSNHIGSYYVGVSFSKSNLISLGSHFLVGQKQSVLSTFYSHIIKSCVPIRGVLIIRCIQIPIPTTLIFPVKIQSCYGSAHVLVNTNRSGLGLISPTHLFIVIKGFTQVLSISLSVKRINPSGYNGIFLIRAFIAMC